MPPFEDLQVPKLPSTEYNTLDDDNTLTLNDSDIDLWQSERIYKHKNITENPPDTDTNATKTNLSVAKTQLDQDTTQCSRSPILPLRNLTYIAPSKVNIPMKY